MGSLLINTHHKEFASSTPSARTMEEVWAKSTVADRDGYLSYVLNEWARFPVKMPQQLEALPFINWTVQRKGLPTFWMEMFLVNRCVFDLSSPRGQTAWQHWWSYRHASCRTAAQTFSPINSLQHAAEMKNGSPSVQRSLQLIEFLPHMVTNGCSIEVVNTLAQALIAIADEHNTRLPPEWNALSGIVAEVLTPFVLQNPQIAPQVKKWWDNQDHVMHPSRMRLPLSQNEIGLVGRPEYIFSYMIKEVVLGAFHKMPTGEDPQKRWDDLEQGFWAACKKRWEVMGAPAREQFFLPSLNLMVSHTYKEITKACAGPRALEYTSKLEKLALLAATACWPWERESTPPRRKM